MHNYLERELCADRLRNEINAPDPEFYFAILNDDHYCLKLKVNEKLVIMSWKNI
jgi:hypothetical protein